MRGERRGDLLVAHELGAPQEQHVAVGREQAAVVRRRVVVPGLLQEAGVKIGDFMSSTRNVQQYGFKESEKMFPGPRRE